MGMVKEWKHLFRPSTRQLFEYTLEKPASAFDRIRFSKGRGRAEFKLFDGANGNALKRFLDTGEFRDFPICRVWLTGRQSSLVGNVKVDPEKIVVETDKATLAWVSTIIDDTISSGLEEGNRERSIPMETQTVAAASTASATETAAGPFRGHFDPKAHARGGAFGKNRKPAEGHNLTFIADLEDQNLEDSRMASFHRMLTNRRIFSALKREGFFIRFRAISDNVNLAGRLFHLQEDALRLVNETSEEEDKTETIPPIHAIKIPISESFGLLFRWNPTVNKFDFC